MLKVLREVDPTRVGLELAVGCHVVELTASRVQRRNPGITAARQVDGRQVERQAQQVVAQRLRHELVDLVALLPGHAAHDGTRRLVRGRATRCKRERVEEGLNQADLAGDEAGVQPVDRLGQHRVAEAIDGMRELGDDEWIDRGIKPRWGQEDVDLRLDFARELFEHQVLVLHLGTELGCLEQALTVPVEGGNVGREDRNGEDWDIEPLIEESDIVRGDGHILGVLDQPVVFGVEYVMY